MNIYPAIDMKEGRCVRLNQGRFDALTAYADDPLEIALKWRDAGAKWLHIVDLDGAKDGRPHPQNRAALKRIRQATDLPIQFGGGVRTQENVEQLLEIGVRRVVLGTAAARNPELAQSLFQQFGEAIAVGVDAKDGKVAVQGWQEESGAEAPSFVQAMERLGAKIFIFTDIARDGMLQGVNFQALLQIAAAVPKTPVVASGGVANIQDIHALCAARARSAPNIDGVIIGKALYAGTLDLAQAIQQAQNAPPAEA